MIGEQPPTGQTAEADRFVDLRDASASDNSAGHEPDHPLKGLAYLQEYCQNDPKSLAANYALALWASLQQSKDAMATGHDISILGVPSQTLLGDVLLTLPIGVQPADPAGRILFAEMTQDIGNTTPEQFADLLVDFLRAIHEYWAYFPNRSEVENKNIRDNLQPVFWELRYVTEGFIDRRLEQSPLPHEGGADVFEPELLRDLCEPQYLRLAFRGDPSPHQRSGLSGQTLMRLMNEARLLELPDAERSLQ